MLVLENYEKNIGSVEQFQEDLYKQLDVNNKLFIECSLDDLVEESIKCIYFDNSLEKVEDKISHVLNYCGISSKGNNKELFKEHILGLETTPYEKYLELNLKVERDLESINTLLNKYEKEKIIEEYLLNLETKRDVETINALLNKYQKEKTIGIYLSDKSNEKTSLQDVKIIDFYKRTLAQQKRILDYSEDKIKKIALYKCGIFYNTFSHLDPYTYYSFSEFPLYIFNLHHDKIDEVFHRCSNLIIKKGMELMRVYKNDKSLFYKLLFKELPVTAIFEDIFTNLAYIEEKRMPIFEELKFLFDNEKWYGFYSLAALQIEGLVGDVLKLNKKSRASKEPISKKIHFLEEKYNNLSRMDYFKYIFAVKRNSFAHTGLIDNVVLSSYDVLTDIYYLINRLGEVDNPNIHFKKIVNRGIIYFKTYEDFNTYFAIITHKNFQKSYVHEVKNFNSEIINNVKIEEIVNKAIEILKEKLFKIQEIIKQSEINIYHNPSLLKRYIDDCQIEEIEKLNYFFCKIIKKLNYTTADFSYWQNGHSQTLIRNIIKLKEAENDNID